MTVIFALTHNSTFVNRIVHGSYIPFSMYLGLAYMGMLTHIQPAISASHSQVKASITYVFGAIYNDICSRHSDNYLIKVGALVKQH